MLSVEGILQFSSICLHLIHIPSVALSRGEQIWNKTTSKPPTLAPSIWYEWAEDPNLLDQFHTAIMESKKQMNVLALAISKPVNFCLWYYYHEYKTSKNKKLYEALKKMMIDEMSTQNSNECAICNGGGEILCCDTCPEAVSLLVNCSGCFNHCHWKFTYMFVSLAILRQPRSVSPGLPRVDRVRH